MEKMKAFVYPKDRKKINEAIENSGFPFIVAISELTEIMELYSLLSTCAYVSNYRKLWEVIVTGKK